MRDIPPDLEALRQGYIASAMQPALRAFKCRCGRPRCVFRPGYLVPFRTHLANLHHVLADAHYSGGLRDGTDHGWAGVTYQLKMAASIEDLTADTGYVDLSGSTLMCRPAAEYEDRHSLLASRYAAALIVFNFIWAAYEAAVKVGAGSFRPKDTTAFRGRELMALHGVLGKELKCLRRLARHAGWSVLHIGDLERDRGKLDSFQSGSAAYAAELARIFRNHIAHGSDNPPQPDQGHGYCRILRFYEVSRLLLLLIQIVAVQAMPDPNWEYEAWDDIDEGRPRTLRSMFLRLQFEACRM